MNNKGFEVSVIIPVYNCAKFLRQAVESALQQEETAEVILVEDASPDNALEICQQLEKEYNKVKLYRHQDKKNHGAGASRNLGIEKAGCEFIAFLDGDDYYLPDRFKKTREVFNKHPDCDGVYEAAINNIDKHLKTEAEKHNKLQTINKDNIPPSKLLYSILFENTGWFCTNGIVLKKNSYGNIRFDEELELSQDTLFWIMLCVKSKLYPGNINWPVAVVRRHKNNRAKFNNYHQNYQALMWYKAYRFTLKHNQPNEIVKGLLKRTLSCKLIYISNLKVNSWQKKKLKINFMLFLISNELKELRFTAIIYLIKKIYTDYVRNKRVI